MDLNTKGFIKKKVSFALKMIVLVICFIIICSLLLWL